VKNITLLLIISLLFCGLALAADNELPSAGTLPDSPFYFLKSWKESVQMFFTFGAENKAKQFLHLADVRLAEYQKMIEVGKTDIAEKTLAKYGDQLNRALEKANEVKAEDAEKLKEAIGEKILGHEEALQKTLEKVPEQAREGIKNAIEVSRQGFESAIGAISGEKKGELEKRAEEIKLEVEGKLGIVGPSFVPTSSAAGSICIQVITPATGPDGTCKEFPTPCDVPADWKKVDKCPQAATIPPTTTEKPIIGQAPTEIRYYTCPDGTKVESGKCYAGGGCIIQMTPELQCPASTPPVTKGGECQTLGEIKYYQCPSSSQISQVPWCGCGAASPLAGAKNIWRCQYLPELSCPKPAPIPTPTPTEPLSYTSCTKGGMKDHACSDGTMVRWQCQCFTHDVAISSADYHYDCDLEPAKYCSASNVSAPLTVTRINVRLQEGAKSPSIFWTTNVPVLSYIEHGPTAYYGFRDNGLPNTPDTNFVVWSLTQGGTSIESKLQPDTLYHFRIVAEDTKGNKFVSQDYTFFTGQ
jgi:hypothetical protein